MATRSLGTLTLDLVAKIGGFTQGMDQASRIADKRMRSIEQRANAFGRSLGTSIRSAAKEFLAFAGVSFTIGAAFESLKNAIDLADETRDLSIRLGVSTEAISDFRYAAQQTGTDMDTLGKGMKILAKNVALAQNATSSQAKIFDALGVSTTDAQGNLRNLADLIPDIADKFKGLEDGTQKAALAQALFGKSGLDLTEFLNSGAAGLDAYGDKLRELGGEITPEAARNADEFNDHLADLKTAFSGAALQVASKLVPAMDDLIVDLTQFTASNAADTANDIATGFEKMGQAADSLSGVVDTLEKIHDFLAASDALAKSFGNFTGVSKFGEAMKRNFPWLYGGASAQKQASAFTGPQGLQIPVLNGQSNSFNATQPQFSAVPKPVPRADTSALNAALGHIRDPKVPKGHAGKSDAQREAEQVARAIEQMTRAQKDWEAEVAQTGNPIADEYTERLRQINDEAEAFAQDKVPADKVQAFTDKMKELAATLRDADVAKFQKEFDDQTAEMVAQMQGPAAEALQQFNEDVSALDDLFKRGQISIDEYNARLAVLGQIRDSPMAQVNADLEEQIRLLGMSNEQQEIYNNLKQAGVRADEPWGQVIIANTQRLQEQRQAIQDQIDIMDGLRDSAGVFFDDLKKGEGIWDSLKDAAGHFADVLYDIASKKLIEQIFGQQGTTGTGSSGQGWLGAILSLFTSSGSFGGSGSPLASGGPVDPMSIHQVGEFDRPEVFMSRGKNWLLPGNSGRVVPLREFGNGGHSPMTINFNVQGKVTRETGTQAGKRVATETRLAQARNS